MKEKRHFSRGASLLELLVYIGIFSVVSTLFVSTLFSANLGWTRSKVQAEVQQNLRFVAEDIARTAQNAQAITSPAPGASANALSLVVNGETVQYSLSGNAVQKQRGANPAETLTTSAVRVTYLYFQTLQNTAASNAAVQATSTQFALSVEYNAQNEQFAYTQHATSTATLRNK